MGASLAQLNNTTFTSHTYINFLFKGREATYAINIDLNIRVIILEVYILMIIIFVFNDLKELIKG